MPDHIAIECLAKATLPLPIMSTLSILNLYDFFLRCPQEITLLIVEWVLLTMDYDDGDDTFWSLVVDGAPRTKLILSGHGGGKGRLMGCAEISSQVRSS